MRALGLPASDWKLIVAGSVLLVGAYPPFHLLLPSFTCLIPAVLLIEVAQRRERPLKTSLMQGFWFGLLSNGLVLYWIAVALWHFTALSALGYFATIVILAGYSSILFALVGWVNRKTGISLIMVFPVMWTATEWAIGHQGDIRLPWLGLGTSLTGYPVLVQIADVIGARGVTLLLAAANAALAMALVRRHDRRKLTGLIGAVVLGIALSFFYGLYRSNSLPLREVGLVTVIQPNVGFEEKWDRALRERIVTDLLEQSAEAARESQPDLVVWPEVAVPGYFVSNPQWETLIERHATRWELPVVFGGLDAEFRDDGTVDRYNAAFFVDPARPEVDPPAYRKRYLVPITERVPFVNPEWFADLEFFGGFAIGERLPVYSFDGGRFGVIICYESAFEDLGRAYRKAGADFLVNITNDAWFGETSAPYQHAAHLVMRAIENRVGIARAANTGISEFVDPLGRERHRTGLGVEAAVSDTVLTADVFTWYTRLGDWVGVFAVLATLGLSLAGWWSKR